MAFPKPSSSLQSVPCRTKIPPKGRYLGALGLLLAERLHPRAKIVWHEENRMRDRELLCPVGQNRQYLSSVTWDTPRLGPILTSYLRTACDLFL